MKKTFLSLFALCALSASAQSEIVVGDMNDDGQLSVGDITALTESVVGRQAVRRINVAGDPYTIDNASIVGVWTGISGTITFGPDGTTDYKDGYTYEFLPSQSLIVFYDETKAAKEFLEVVILKSNKLILSDVSMTKAYTYGEHFFIADDGTIYGEDTNGHRYVDLGLPSGTLWAMCNVGADSPEDYGGYFTWGEIEPKSDSNSGMFFDMDGYKYNIHNGKTELDLEDDAAYMNWGEGWHMPSTAQQEELCTECIWTWKSVKGITGYEVKSKKNKNSIFLPAAGYPSGGGAGIAGSNGSFWSRSLLYTVESDCAYVMYFNLSQIGIGAGYRYDVHSIRPVRQ